MGDGSYKGSYLYDKTKEGNGINVPAPGDKDGAYVKVTDGGFFIVKESFDENELEEDNKTYMIQSEFPTGKMGVGIFNNHATEEVVIKINDINIPVPPKKPWYGVFIAQASIELTGTEMNFDVFLEG